MMRSIVMSIMLMAWCTTFAAITVSDVKVFSGYPWKEVVVGYTITGTDVCADVVRLTATDKAANKSYTANTLSGGKLTEGRHILRWNAASEGVKFSSANVVFGVSVVNLAGVQLWENGPRWAECNVGATEPEEYGYYFDWAGTVGYKRVYDSDLSSTSDRWGMRWRAVGGSDERLFSSRWADHSQAKYKSIAELKAEGYIDSAGNLVAEYDAATKNLGALWRMPTAAEWDALISKCTTTWTTRNGVYGRLVKGKGDYASRSIFLPAAGYGSMYNLNSSGTNGEYWSSTPDSGSSDRAGYLEFDSSTIRKGSEYLYRGLPVRPVRRPFR